MTKTFKTMLSILLAAVMAVSMLPLSAGAKSAINRYKLCFNANSGTINGSGTYVIDIEQYSSDIGMFDRDGDGFISIDDFSSPEEHDQYQLGANWNGKGNDWNFTLADYVPVRKGYTFEGWYIDSALQYEALVTPDTAIEQWINNARFGYVYLFGAGIRINFTDSYKYLDDEQYQINLYARWSQGGGTDDELYQNGYKLDESTGVLTIINDKGMNKWAELTHEINHHQVYPYKVAYEDKELLSKVREIKVGDAVTVVHEFAFHGCTNLIKVNIPAGVKTIENNAFQSCTALTTVDFAGGDTDLDLSKWCFADCTSLEKITLPANLMYVRNEAFANCTALKDLTVLGVKYINGPWDDGYYRSEIATDEYDYYQREFTSYGALYNTSPDIVIHVPTELEEDFKQYTCPGYDFLINTDGERYPVYINGTCFTSEKLTIKCGDGTASYDPQTVTLTLDNAVIEKYTNDVFRLFSKDGSITDSVAFAVIKADLPHLTINVKGKNFLGDDDSGDGDRDGRYLTSGIYVTGSLTMGGGGELTFPGNTFEEYKGIDTKGDVTINNVTLRSLDYIDALDRHDDVNVTGQGGITLDHTTIDGLGVLLADHITIKDSKIEDWLETDHFQNKIQALGDVSVTNSTVRLCTEQRVSACLHSYRGKLYITDSRLELESDQFVPISVDTANIFMQGVQIIQGAFEGDPSGYLLIDKADFHKDSATGIRYYNVDEATLMIEKLTDLYWAESNLKSSYQKPVAGYRTKLIKNGKELEKPSGAICMVIPVKNEDAALYYYDSSQPYYLAYSQVPATYRDGCLIIYTQLLGDFYVTDPLPRDNYSIAGTVHSEIIYEADDKNTYVELYRLGEDEPCASTHNVSRYGSDTFDFSMSDIQPGTYTVRVTKEGHIPHEETIVLKGTKEEYSLDITLIPEGGYILGDADGDGEVTIIDATCIQRHLASFPTFAYHEEVADADGDGEITIVDATYIQRWLASLKSNDNIGKPINNHT